MRVLTFLHSFEPGGVERDALRFNDAWHRAGIDVQIVLGRRDGRLAEEAPDLDYTVLQNGRLSTAAFETLWMIAKLPAAIRTLKPDVLFCAGNTYSVVAVAMRLLLGRACPPIILRVSNDLRRMDRSPVFRWLHRNWLKLQAPVFHTVVAMADVIVPEIVAEMNIDPRRVVTVNNGSIRLPEAEAMARIRDETPRSSNQRQFVAIGRLVSQKNFSALVKAFAIIAKPDDRLTIVGEGDQRRQLELLSKRLGRADQIMLPGHVNPVGQFLASADAYVMSSDYEGLPAVIVEALAAGLPIVATNCSVTMAMLVEDAGIVVPVKDMAALARAMDAIAGHPVNVDAMRARAATFTVETTTSAWTSLFARVVSSSTDFSAPQTAR